MPDVLDDAVAWNLGRYTLFGEIAAGGMATVHFARLSGGAGFAKTVAIKRLHRQFAKDPEFREMLVDEARLAARIRHPNVVQTLDVVATEDELFLVMEYVHGEALSRVMRELRGRKEPIPPKIAGAVFSGVLHGLHAAHEAKADSGEPLNIVHRDVSPQNVLVGADGIARVIDFGIAKAKNKAQVTREGEIRGKLPYLAPEQFGTTAVTRRIDIYSAAVVLWEMLAGRRLFEGEVEPQVYSQIIAGAREPPSAHARDIPAALDEVVMRGLARNPNSRYATAREMALALEEATPLAPASQVGAWVERIARNALGERAKRLAEVERVGSSPSSEEAPVSMTPQPVSRREPPPPASRASRELPPPVSRPSGHVAPASRKLPPPDIDPLAPPPPPPPPGTFSPLVGMDAPTLPGRLATPPKRGRRVDFVFVIAILSLLGVGAYAALPAALKGTLASRAQARGLTLTIEQVDAGIHKLRLKGVDLRAADLPGFALKAKAVDVTLSELQIEALAATDVDVTIDGSYGSVMSSLERWRATHALRLDPPLHALVGENVHLIWTRPLGDQTRLEIENGHAEVVRHDPRALGEDVALTMPLFKLETPAGTLGPYSGTATRDPDNLHARFTLDTTGAAILQGTLASDGTAQVELDTPPLALSSLGVPPALAAATRIAGTARAAVPAHGQIDARVDLTFSGLRVAGGTSDVRIEAEVAGDMRKALPLANAAVTFDGLRAPATGTVEIGGGGTRIDVAYQSAKRACPGAEPTSVAGALSLDTRRLEETRAQVTGLGRCPARRGAP